MGHSFSETLNGPNTSWTKEDAAGLSDHVLNRSVDIYTQTIVPTTIAWYSVHPSYSSFSFFALPRWSNSRSSGVRRIMPSFLKTSAPPLYLFELSYRHSMRLPLSLHHICTLFVIILLFSPYR
ncbi:hypothetical protein BS47DRAFT_911984 [Hydnum rufescens UP504]|uniref:Uncharacterized protein n=1 Tax=Hydnum rufescens UP504 TaxID=1448309 RepID=A0A9P6AY26_9AGAM|nr:hypothetical protein BS47DRAFT_911984 [Hydnum rufescens UP504]